MINTSPPAGKDAPEAVASVVAGASVVGAAVVGGSVVGAAVPSVLDVGADVVVEASVEVVAASVVAVVAAVDAVLDDAKTSLSSEEQAIPGMRIRPLMIAARRKTMRRVTLSKRD